MENLSDTISILTNNENVEQISLSVFGEVNQQNLDKVKQINAELIASIYRDSISKILLNAIFEIKFECGGKNYSFKRVNRKDMIIYKFYETKYYGQKLKFIKNLVIKVLKTTGRVSSYSVINYNYIENVAYIKRDFEKIFKDSIIFSDPFEAAIMAFIATHELICEGEPIFDKLIENKIAAWKPKEKTMNETPQYQNFKNRFVKMNFCSQS